MESIGYIINRNFVLIAVDTNYNIQTDKTILHVPNLRKIYKLNDNNIISVIGNPYRSTDVIKYVMKLNELGYNGTYSQIKEDLKDAFDNSKGDVIENVKKLAKILPSFQDENGYLKINDLTNHLENEPGLLNLFTESIRTMQNSTPTIAQILVFGWNKELKKMRLYHSISLGQELIENEYDFTRDLLYTRFLSSTKQVDETQKTENELGLNFSSFLSTGWDEQTDKICDILRKGKEILTEGLIRISPYESQPNIIFYELSYRTDYIFKEPEIKLVNLTVNR